MNYNGEKILERPSFYRKFNNRSSKILMIHLSVLEYNIYLNLIWLDKETRRKYVSVDASLNRLVMAHGSSRVKAVNVTKKIKHHFFGMQFLRQTTPHHVFW